mmetsp:Transcript_19997/g.46539  ORF Transcript_19997/g.46539 Transcript_19997/m.46539 type:complete len:509 (-) Transcript_19997:203-1729(-)
MVPATQDSMPPINNPLGLGRPPASPVEANIAGLTSPRKRVEATGQRNQLPGVIASPRDNLAQRAAAKSSLRSVSTPRVRRGVPESPAVRAAAAVMVATPRVAQEVAQPAYSSSRSTPSRSCRHAGQPLEQRRQTSLGLRPRRHSAYRGGVTDSDGEEECLATLQPAAACGDEELERIGCCTREEFHMLFDVFAAMDRAGAGAISRSDYVWALKSLGTSINFHKLSRRAKLEAYFHQSSLDLPLPALLRRSFPAASLVDIRSMLRWAQLRRAYLLVCGIPGIEGRRELTETSLRRSFSILVGQLQPAAHHVSNGDEVGAGSESVVKPSSMVSAQLLSRAAATELSHEVDDGLDFLGFCTAVSQHLGQPLPSSLEAQRVELDSLALPRHPEAQMTHSPSNKATLLAAIAGHVVRLMSERDVEDNGVELEPEEQQRLTARTASAGLALKPMHLDAKAVEAESPPRTPSTCASMSARYHAPLEATETTWPTPLPPRCSPNRCYQRPRMTFSP